MLQRHWVTRFTARCRVSPHRALASPFGNRHFSNEKLNTNNNRLRRVLFNVPGSDERKIMKATTLNLDCVVLDLEDGVALNQKEVARTTVLNSFQKLDFGRAERLIRINAVGSGLEEDDWTQCIKPLVEAGRLDTLVIPKVESVDHLETVHGWLNSTGSGKVKILAAIESARGLVELSDICKRNPGRRLEGLIFASEDLCADMGLIRTPEKKELLYARGHVVTHAHAYRLQAIDLVCLDYNNPEVLTKETIEGKQMGYTGKQAIHPNQIEPIYEAFKPTQKEVEWAQRIIDENDKFQQQGKGAFSLDGKMIDMPMVKWAQRILQRNSM